MKPKHSNGLTKSQLNKKKKNELMALAKNMGVRVTTRNRKDEIIGKILELKKQDPIPRPNLPKKKSSETDVKKSKYEVLAHENEPPMAIEDKKNEKRLSSSYLVLLVQNPYWCFSYWSISPESLENAKDFYGKLFSKTQLVIRVYNQTINENEKRNAYFDIPVNSNAVSWYINIPKPDQQYRAELGYKFNHRFFIIASSNTVDIPAARVKETILETPTENSPRFTTGHSANDRETAKKQSDKILEITVGTDVKSPNATSSQEFTRSILRNVSSHISSHSQIPTRNSEEISVMNETPFFYQLDCEVVIKGKTSPDASVILNDEESIPLDSNGKFKLGFPLNDGLLELKTMAISNDKLKSKTITPIISRKTNY